MDCVRFARYCSKIYPRHRWIAHALQYELSHFVPRAFPPNLQGKRPGNEIAKLENGNQNAIKGKQATNVA